MLRRICPVCCAALCVCSCPDFEAPPKPMRPVTADARVPSPGAALPDSIQRATSTPLPSQVPSLPEGWTDLRALPGLRFDIVYARADNFTGATVPGYAGAGAWMHADAAQALLRAHQSLAEHGLGLLIFDAYRPRRASEHFVAWAQRNGREDLVRDGYIAKRSLHNRGIAVDLGLFDLSEDRPVDMGSGFDSFDAAAHYLNATGPTLEARRQLRDAMLARGFRPYAKEWWHFTYAPSGFEAPDAVDLPYPND